MIWSWPGIILAGGAFASVASVLWNLFSFLSTNMSRPGYMGLSEVFMSVVIITSTISVLGMIIAMISSFVSVPLTLIIQWSFGHSFGPRFLASFAGGLAGFLPSFIFLPYNVFEGESVLISVVSVLLAMLMGHCGAILAAKKAINECEKSQRESESVLGFQFRIRHLLVATVWFASLAMIESLFGNFRFLIWIGAFFVLQAVIVLGDRLWVIYHAQKSGIPTDF